MACGDDSSKECTDADFIGTWSGPIECDSSTVNLVSIEFFDDAGTLTTRYVGNEFPATRSGCNLISVGDFGNYGFDITTSLDGNEMTFALEDFSPFGDDNCTATLTRQ